jgi:hypothetical protein
MKLIQTGSTAAKDDLEFLMIDSSDHVTGKTGLTVTVTLRKPGGSFGSPSGSVSEIANGWYRVAANATDNGTVGGLLLHATATGADPTDDRFEVVGFDPSDATRLGLAALPNAAAGASGGLPTGDASGRVDVSKINGASQGATLSATLKSVARGTLTSGGSTTSVPTSALSIGGSAATGVVADQFKGRTILFDGDTTTAGLRGASAAISASSASNTPTLTVGTLPATPASGDTFSII